MTPNELEERLPSGRDSTFSNRVGWALTHVYQAGLVDRPRRAVYRLTDRGGTVLVAEPQRVDLRVLNQFAEFRRFRSSETPGAPGRAGSRPRSQFGETFEVHLTKFRAAPFLFVGAGLSRRYMQLDGWEALLRRIAGLTDRPYEYYSASADGDLATVASLIAEQLHEPWWREARFKETRDQFAGKLKHRESALKAEASAYLTDSMKRLPTSGDLADELELMRNAVVDGIITTNFDSLLENLFPEFEVFVGQEQLLFNDSVGIAEIYKIHGGSEDPDSLVLTRADYDRFHERNPYLAAKLTTLFVEHPIVFLGYSLSDDNVGTILHSIVHCLDSRESVAKLAERLIFVQWDKTAIPTLAHGVIRVADMPIPVITATVPDFREIFDVLAGLKRKFPAKLLRQLKEEVYALILENDPNGKLHVLPLDPRIDPREAEVVYGVGAIAQVRSYLGYSRDDLVDDVLWVDRGYSAVRILDETLPSMLTQAGNVPIYKYLRAAGLLDNDGNVLDLQVLDDHVAKHVSTRVTRLRLLASFETSAARVIQTASTLAQLIAAVPPHVALRYIPALDEAEIDPAELRSFLVDNESFREDGNRSQWIKIACLYDWLRWGALERT